MGMFDDIRCDMDLPEGGDPCPSKHFQTKSFDDPYLDKYIIHKNGRMTKNGEPFMFHGMVNFYTLEGHPSDANQSWWEYDAKFTDGVCVEITYNSEEQESGR